MTEAEAARLVALLASAYPTPMWASDTLETYVRFLVDLDYGATSAAVMAWIRAEPERPAIAHIREQVAAIHDARKPQGAALEPDEAWVYVMECIRTIGSYERFPATHPLVAEVVRAFGWRDLCLSTNMAADRAHFLQLYRARWDRARHEARASTGACAVAIEGAARPALSGRPI